VLLLDEGWLQTSELASALEAAGFAVTVVTADGSTAQYRRRSVEWRSAPRLASASFLPYLDRLMRDAVFDRVLPLTESALYRLWDAGPAWNGHIYPAADDWQCRLLRDKHLMVEHLAARGVAVPRQLRLSGQSPAMIARELGMPIVIKAATGCGGSHTWIAETQGELSRAIDRARHAGGAWAAQELVAGPTCLVGGVFDRGRPLRIYAAEKLEQHPERTGPAIRLRSDADPALIELGLTVFRELRWTGFASADAIRLRRGNYVFLEVNPRPWGSIAAARTADVDLFAPFAALLAGATPAADLAFAADRDCHVFPRYLLSPRYWRPRGALRALRDLLGPQGDDWRDAGFARHLAARLYRLHRRRR
jgi:hypothetical protein